MKKGESVYVRNHILIPIDRVTKYEMILRTLQESYKKSTDEECTQLNQAIEMIKTKTQMANTSVAIEQISGVDNVSEMGPLLLQNQFSVNGKDKFVFLFRKAVVFTTEVSKMIQPLAKMSSVKEYLKLSKTTLFFNSLLVCLFVRKLRTISYSKMRSTSTICT